MKNYNTTQKALTALFTSMAILTQANAMQNDKPESFYSKHHYTYQPSYTPSTSPMSIRPTNDIGIQGEYTFSNGNSIYGGYGHGSRTIYGGTRQNDITFYGAYTPRTRSGHAGFERDFDGCNLL